MNKEAKLSVTNREQNVNNALHDSGILALLDKYSPTVVSTILVGLGTDNSDIDIICHYHSQSQFIDDCVKRLHRFANWQIHNEQEFVLGRFKFGGFQFEIYGSSTPVYKQLAYRHFQVMQRLVDLGGAKFAAAVVDLKKKGLKTEPAIAQLLNLPGDPYQAVLILGTESDASLLARLQEYRPQRAYKLLASNFL